MRGAVLEKMLSERERQSLYDFFADGFMDRIEAKRGFVYHSGGRSANAWIFRLNSLGIVAPIIPWIWEEWWKLDHPGKAVKRGDVCVRVSVLERRKPNLWSSDPGTWRKRPVSHRDRQFYLRLSLAGG